MPKFDDGHDIALGLTYDSGDYEAPLDKALEAVSYSDLRAEQESARAEDRYMGIGVSTYVEICGLGPSQVAGAVGFQGGLWEGATIKVTPTGKVSAAIGSSPHGQGEETTFAQVIADEIGVDVDDVEILHGDTDNTPMGWGTYGSRTTAVSGAALTLAVRKVKDKARTIAAHLLEAAEEDIEYGDGRFFVRGSPDSAQSIQDIALMANVAWNMPEGMEPGLEARLSTTRRTSATRSARTFAIVDVDPDSGHVSIRRYVAVDDCGIQINPMIVEGQVSGGVVQGAGPRALGGRCVRRQRSAPDRLDARLRPAPRGRGAGHRVAEHGDAFRASSARRKGRGRDGHYRITITLYNAVMDALKPFGVEKIDMPLTPEKVWTAINESRG